MAPIVSVNRGGAVVLVHGLRSFLPGSHLSGMMATEDMIGMELPLTFLEVNQEANKLVVSHRKAVVEQQMMVKIVKGGYCGGTGQGTQTVRRLCRRWQHVRTFAHFADFV